MEEVRSARPLDRPELEGLVGRYAHKAEEGVQAARQLRERIVKGNQVLALPDLSEGERSEASSRMEALQAALREAEWTTALGLGLAMAYGVVTILGESAQKEGWKPPANSLARVYMPGVCDVTVKIDG